MDWTALQKQAVLIPTPGQTEQEYLAEYLRSEGYFYSVKQDEIHLETALRFCVDYHPPAIPQEDLLQKALRVL
jgi:hypothetical protein